MNPNQKQQVKNLWQQHFSLQKSKVSLVDITRNYPEGVSKHHSRFRLVKNFFYEESRSPVFFDEEKKGYEGLRYCQLLFDSHGRPIYLVDNHHEVLLPFLECAKAAKLPFDIVHIDAHRDDAIFLDWPPQSVSLKEISHEISRCRVSDYLDFATRSGIIGAIHSVTQSFEFEDFSLPQKSYILNLDLDIFGEEGSCVSLEKKVAVIAKSWSRADAVCMATSPGFIDQGIAHFLAEVFSGEV